MANNKDWSGNTKTTFVQLGSSNHCLEERETNDYYATEPKAVELLLELEKFNSNIWECASGGGHISEVLIKHGHNVKSTDLINRDYGISGIDFLKETEIFDGDLITNPPYIYAEEFVRKGMELIPKGNKIAMFLKLTFLETKGRKKLFKDFPPKIVYISSSRLGCAKNGDMDSMGNAVCYCWYIWEVGYEGETILKWFN